MDTDTILGIAVLIFLMCAATVFGDEYACTWCVCDVVEARVIQCGPTRKGTSDELAQNIEVSGPGLMIPHVCGDETRTSKPVQLYCHEVSR